MRVFNETKTNVLSEYNLYKGYLKDDRILISHYEANEEHEEYDEYEDIQVYIPYTVEELKQRKEEDYRVIVEAYIREKYSLSAELAILRQRDIKAEEFNEYNAYAEKCKIQAKADILKFYE